MWDVFRQRGETDLTRVEASLRRIEALLEGVLEEIALARQARAEVTAYPPPTEAERIAASHEGRVL